MFLKSSADFKNGLKSPNRKKFDFYFKKKTIVGKVKSGADSQRRKYCWSCKIKEFVVLFQIIDPAKGPCQTGEPRASTKIISEQKVTYSWTELNLHLIALKLYGCNFKGRELFHGYCLMIDQRVGS